jgi:isocitrate lyase
MAEKFGYGAVKHQRFVGTGYFDELANTIAAGQTSIRALPGSTEEEQFEDQYRPVTPISELMATSGMGD